ncbi:MAG: hypothetical protein ACOYM9_21190 [Bradymonadia bacterium]
MRSAVCRMSLMTLSLPFLLAACGGDDDDGTGGGGGPAAPADFEQASGVSGSTGISSLSPEQAQSVCDAFKSYFDSQISVAEKKKVLCTVAGVFAASFGAMGGSPNPADCRAVYEECQAAPFEEDGTDECTVADVPEDCPATLDEFEACAQATAQAFKALAASLSDSCSAVANPTAREAVLGGQTEPAACKSLYEKCPSLQDDDEE